MSNSLDIVYLDPLSLQPDVMLIGNYNEGGSNSSPTITYGAGGDISTEKGSLTNFALYVQGAFTYSGVPPTDSTPAGWTKIFTNASVVSGLSIRVSVFYKTGAITANITGGLSGLRSIGKVYLFKIKNLTTPTVTVEDFDSSGTTPTPASQNYTYTGGNPSLGFAVKGVYESLDANINSDIVPKYTDESSSGYLGLYGTLRVNLYPYNSNAPTINVSSTIDDGDVEVLGGGYVSFS